MIVDVQILLQIGGFLASLAVLGYVARFEARLMEKLDKRYMLKKECKYEMDLAEARQGGRRKHDPPLEEETA